MGGGMQVRKLVVKGDTLSIIKKCKKRDIDRFEISTIISNIHQRSTSFQEISFMHVPRSGNLITHTLAKESLRRNEVFYLNGLVSNFAVNQMGTRYRSNRETD